VGFFSTVIPEQDVYSATWLNKYFNDHYNRRYINSFYKSGDYNNDSYPIYSDHTSSFNVLASYGMFGRSNFFLKDEMYEFKDNSYVYLSYCNIVENLGNGPYEFDDVLNMTKTYELLKNKNLIYSSKDSKIYKT